MNTCAYVHMITQKRPLVKAGAESLERPSAYHSEQSQGNLVSASLHSPAAVAHLRTTPGPHVQLGSE